MSTTTQLINNNFGGIRRKDALFSGDKITCSDCQNIELFYTELNAGIGIRVAKGNKNVSFIYKTTNISVYSIDEEDVTLVVNNAVLDNGQIVFTSDDVEHNLDRYNEKDIVIEETEYYAWVEGLNDEQQIFYTTEYGNNIIDLIPSNEKVIGIYESNQGINAYCFVHTESSTQSKVYNFNTRAKTLTEFDLTPALGNTLFKATGLSCGVDYSQGVLDMFCLSNGEQIIYIYTDVDDPTQISPVVESHENVELEDTEENPVKGLGMCVFDSRLWVFNDRRVWYSQQGNCRVFNYVDPSAITSSGFIDFVKPITAIYPYLGSLAVFHKDSSALITLDSTTVFAVSDESPGGCASYKSLVFHGTDLYFYDDTKKGVYSFQQVVNGDKTLGENIALNIQDELMQISNKDLDKIKALSVVTEDRNEVWFLLPISKDENHSLIMIYDYIRGEWIKRKCQNINCMSIYDSVLHSGGNKIYEEYVGEDFDGEYIQSYYICSLFNYGAENTMKITKFPPRITVDGNFLTDFWVKYVKNYAVYKTPKIKEIKTKQNNNVLIYDTDDCYDSNKSYVPNNINANVKLPSATFKTLEITFYTQNVNEYFAIKSIEFSKLKIKQV